ncbi:hypothetical protein EVAR_93029_1 [Eumeta japonica]|uniref:Uncharacterized protein n=1 Tax=Eumeta variegata TaxID=151549 RepID=A0A4C1SBW1_EUMVA|nr:hypothetical protein EVAR_93029_1 [Eumeta japonica]
MVIADASADKSINKSRDCDELPNNARDYSAYIRKPFERKLHKGLRVCVVPFRRRARPPPSNNLCSQPANECDRVAGRIARCGAVPTRQLP